ncbi:MAG: hypothetical protein KKA84_09755 [Bacteroidetes bacterium]|nr:hypothetical protein [Bacteroidota bacterium]
MNKFTRKLILMAITLTVLLLLQVFTFAEVRSLMNLKMEAEKVRMERLANLESKIVDVQRLSSEERIQKLATDSLALVKAERPYKVIEISQYEVEQITKIVENKYE